MPKYTGTVNIILKIDIELNDAEAESESELNDGLLEVLEEEIQKFFKKQSDMTCECIESLVNESDVEPEEE